LNAEETLKYMLVFFQNIDKRLNELSKEQSVADIKQDEILHYIENHKLNAIQSCRLVKLLKEIRDERRLIKDEIDVIRSLKDTFVDKYKNKFIEKDIIQAIKNLKALENKQNNPKYTYQYLTEELEIKDGQD
jgi:esterase/lipase